MSAALPFLRWAGGKRWLAERLAERVRPRLEEGTYIEPFLGGGAMYFALRPPRAILSDNNVELIETYRTLGKSSAAIAKGLAALPVSKEQYDRIRESVPSSRVERAIRFIYLNRTCYAGVYLTNREGIFNVPYGGGDRNAKAILENGILETSAQVLRETRQLELVTGDFEFSINRANSGDIIYADPCYRGASRLGHDTYGPKRYSFDDQKRLAKCLVSAYEKGALVLLSTQVTEGFEELAQRGLILPLWRRPGLTGRYQNGKEFLIVLDPKSELSRWEPFSDFTVKLNGKHSTESVPVRARSPQELAKQIGRAAARYMLRIPPPGRSNPGFIPKWPAALKELFEKNPQGLRYSEIVRKLGISAPRLTVCLRGWKEEKQIEKDATTGLWKIPSNTLLIVSTGTITSLRDRMKITGLGRPQQFSLDRIARHRRDLLEEIAEGRLSINAAFELYRGAHNRQKSALRRAWKNANPAERQNLLTEIGAVLKT